MQFQFSCPLEGCDQVLVVDAENKEEGAKKLVEAAKIHLAEMHPQVHKTDEQVNADIRSRMESVVVSS